MSIETIDKTKCQSCSLRVALNCPAIEACHTDVLRLDKEGFPYIAYARDCDSCFFCELDCPEGAIKVSAKIPLPFLGRP